VGIGETLTQARRAAGLTVTEISAKTKIRVPIIEALEQDDYTLCGGDFYVRAQLRSIAQAIGIDPAPLVDSFDQSHGWSAAGPPLRLRPNSPTVHDRLGRLSRRYRPTWAMVAAIPLVAIIGYAMFALITGANGRPHSPATGPNSPGHGSVTSAVRRAAGNVEVHLYAKRTSQVSVHDAAGKLLFNGTVEARSHQAWTGRQRLTLTLFDAGATQLTVNGKDLGLPGKPGQVMQLSFGPEDPKKTRPW
jgi:transcriptional regulator with XRE-family HTH domain